MPIIVPSILETTKSEFLNTLSKEVKLPGVNRIQIDFADGVFVPNKLVDISEVDSLSPAFHFEAHLMVNAPKDFVDYKISGFRTIILHFEAYKTTNELLLALKDIKEHGMEAGLCIKVETPVSVLKQFEGIVNNFQIMSVHPGFQGTVFIEQTYERIKELRLLLPNAIIEVDGGINRENIKKVFEVGANIAIAGSVITKDSNMQEAWEHLKQIIQE